MTRVYYMVGEHRYDSYKNAKIASSFARKPMRTCYETIEEECKVDPKMRVRRVAAIQAKAAQRKARA